MFGSYNGPGHSLSFLENGINILITQMWAKDLTIEHLSQFLLLLFVKGNNLHHDMQRIAELKV